MTAKRHVDYVRDYSKNLVPVIPHDATLSPNSKIDPLNRGKVPGQRKADGTWYGGWKDLGDATIALAKKWDEWGAFIGNRTGNAGVFAHDVDLTVRADAERVLALAYGIYGRNLAVRRVDHPAHTKLLICLRLEGPMPASFNIDVVQSNGAHGQIQFLGPGRYFNMHGIHPKRLRPYVWENDPADVPLVSVNLAEFEAFWVAIGQDFEVTHRPRLYAFNQVQREPERCTPEEMEALVELIPNDKTFEPYGEFIEMGAAMYGASGGADWGRVQWLAWCDQVDQPQDRKPEIFWDSMRQSRSGAGKLRMYANQRQPLEMARRDFADPPIEEVAPELVAEADTDAEARLAFLNNWCLVGGDFYVMPPRSSIRPIKAADFNLLLAADEKILRRALGGGKRTLAYIFSQRSQNKARGVVNEPGKDRFLTLDGQQFLNLWSAPPRPWKGKLIDPKIIDFYRDLASFVFGDLETVRLWFLWHAWMLQNPDKAPGWHWIIQTKGGRGKDLLLQPLRKAHGDDFYQATPNLLASQFNDYAEKHLVGVSEMKEKARDDVYTNLQLITSGVDVVMVRRIRQAAYAARNVVGLVIFSNEHHPLKIPAEDRRFRVAANFADDQREAHYYAEARASFNVCWPVISEYLHCLPISPSDALLMTGNAPESDAKEQMAETAWEYVFKEWQGEIEMGGKGAPHGMLPVATTTEILKEIELRGVPKSEMPDLRALSDMIYRLGARPLNPAFDNPKRANPIMGHRLWRLTRYWTDPSGVRWDLESCSPSRLARLYNDRTVPSDGLGGQTMPRMTRDDLRVVDEDEI